MGGYDAVHVDAGAMMATEIVTFAYRRGVPAPGPGGVVIDVRDFANPFRQASGNVDRYIKTMTRNYAERMADIRQQVQDCSGTAYIGCFGGRHRSVHVARILGRELGIGVRHMDLGGAD